MKRSLSSVFLCCLAATLLAGCAKSAQSGEGAHAAATGPISDIGSTGLKPEGTAGALAVTGDAAAGKEVFTRNCSACHGATGTEGGVGPSLKNEKTRKNYAQAVAWIKNPQPPMPKLYPATLSEKDVDDAAAYVQSL